MIGIDFDDSIILEQRQVLEHALSTNPKTQQALRKLIRQELIEARKKVVSTARANMESDPRGAAQAVRTAVYKKILGANINIYNSRRSHGSNNYEPPRKGVSGRGGNRRERSGRTTQIMRYPPLDRGFILRWLNEGTPGGRNIAFTANKSRKVDGWNKHPNTGNRGNIAPRNFFAAAGDKALAQAVDNLATLIDKELEQMLNNKK